MVKLTVEDLQEMKRTGKKIVACIVYDYQMARIADMAGADVLTVGDSLGRYVLGQPDVHECTVNDMIPFAKAVVRAAERAVVSVDMPMTPSHTGVSAVVPAARRFKDLGADMTKIDLRTMEEELFEEVAAVAATGLAVFPQIGAPTQGPDRGRRSGPEVLQHLIKWGHAIQDAGASMIDLTSVTPDIYFEVCGSMRIPVIGAGAPPGADGKITGLGIRADSIGQPTTGRANAAQFIYDNLTATITNIREGNF